MKLPFPSEVEYMPLRSELKRAEHRAMVKDSILGFVFLILSIFLAGVILWLL